MSADFMTVTSLNKIFEEQDNKFWVLGEDNKTLK